MTLEAPARVRVQALPALVGIAVVAQIAYPLLSGRARDALTVFIVVVVAAAPVVHAAVAYRPQIAAALVATTVVGGFRSR